MPNKVLTKKLKQQIAELVCTGLDVVDALKKLNSPVKPNTVYKEQAKDKEFADLMQDAYFAHMMVIKSEVMKLANMTASEAYPNLDFREGAEALKRKTQVYQHILDKLGPVLTRKLDKATVTKVEHSGTVQGLTVIMDNYFANQPTEEDSTNSLISH